MLVFQYLRIVLQRPEEFRHILSITFTNKAAEEMKSRIISALSELAFDKNKNLAEHLQSVLPPSVNVKKNAAACLGLILHNYSDFSVSTIDSFFYQIIRSIAREINLPAGVNVETDMDAVIESISDELFAEIGSDEKLTRWLTGLMLRKIDDDGHWRIDREIEFIGRELFKDDSEKLYSISIDAINDLSGKLNRIKKNVESELLENAQSAMTAFNASGLLAKDFYYGNKGVIGYFDKLSKGARGKNISPNSYARKTYDEGIWCSDKSPLKEKINQLAERELFPRLENIIMLLEKEGEKYFSALEVLKYIYVLGIVGDLNKKLTEYRSENKVVLISDNTKLISQFISSEDAPFIFDKTGMRYRHFLIDEFQDTSTIQWQNLLPFIRNSLAEGNFTVIVGDVKQSIYRWRGGNIQLLSGEIRNNLPEFSQLIKEENLVVNRRSKQSIVDFNNKFFTTSLLKLNQFYDGSFSEIYSEEDIVQKTDEKNIPGGYVNIKFLSEENPEEDDASEAIDFKERAMSMVLSEIRLLLEEGFEYKDIALLFRKNAEGNAMAEYLFRNGIKKVISPDSLLLTGSPDVRFIISLFRYLVNPENVVSRTHILHHYNIHSPKKSPSSLHAVFSDSKTAGKSSGSRGAKNIAATLFDIKPHENNLLNKSLPEEFIMEFPRLLNLPVYELCETLIRIFALNKTPDAYIQRFQDCVLEHTRKRNSSVRSFLEWWDENCEKDGNSVLLPESENAIRIMTIHKVKGLQFPVVFIPFFNWKIMPPLETLLWTATDVAPFSEIKKIPVRFGSSLEKTLFKEHYFEERRNYVSDAFNMIYVAFTRAMERMYILSPSVKLPVNEPKNSKDILAATLAEMSGADELKEFTVGEKASPKKKSGKENVSSSLLSEYISDDWRNKISIAEKNSLHSEVVKERLRKVRYGSAVHRVLSDMKTADDIEPALNRIVYAEMIDDEAKSEMRKQIQGLFETEIIKGFFSGEWTALTERDILLPDGKILRPDRVLINGKEAVVIDFKTGREKPEHTEQVKNYAVVLEKMNYNKVKKYLVYLEEAKVVSVES